MKIWSWSLVFLSFVISCSSASNSHFSANAASSGRIQAQICEDLTAMLSPNISETELSNELQDPKFQEKMSCHQNKSDQYPFGLSNLEVYMINEYSGTAVAEKLNRSIRENNCSKYVNASRILASAVNKIPARRGTVYRGLGLSPEELTAQFKVGSVYQSPSFMSTSISPLWAVFFAQTFKNEFGKEGAILEIRNGAGGYLADFGSVNYREMEVLLVPGTTFTVDSIETVTARGRNFQLVKMTQTSIPPNPIVEKSHAEQPEWKPLTRDEPAPRCCWW